MIGAHFEYMTAEEIYRRRFGDRYCASLKYMFQVLRDEIQGVLRTRTVIPSICTEK